jgi:hypothetical protein
MFDVQPSRNFPSVQEAAVESENSEELLLSSPNQDERGEADTPTAESSGDSAVKVAEASPPAETALGDPVVPMPAISEQLEEQPEERADEHLWEDAHGQESVVKVV